MLIDLMKFWKLGNEELVCAALNQKVLIDLFVSKSFRIDDLSLAKRVKAFKIGKQVFCEHLGKRFRLLLMSQLVFLVVSCCL